MRSGTMYLRQAVRQSSLVAIFILVTSLVLPGKAAPVLIEDSLHRDVPGYSGVAAWGWVGSICYEVVPFTGYGINHFRRFIIDEPWKWGANLLEFYPGFFQPDWGQFQMPWPDRVPGFPKPTEYAWYADHRWSVDVFRELTRYSHGRDFLVQWLIQPRLCPAGDDEANLLAWRFMARTYGDVLRLAPVEMIDGMGAGYGWTDLASLTDGARESNPAMYLYSSNPGSGTMPERPIDVHPNRSPGRPMGYDDHLGFADTSGYRADSRMWQPGTQAWEQWSQRTGGAFPDWILKQAGDYFRSGMQSPSEFDARAIWWLGEPNSVLPRECRKYVYIASMDPLRHAAAARLWTTGIDGYSDRWHAMLDTPIKHRYPHAFDSAYIGNNYLRIYREAGRDGGSFVIDPSRSGEFDIQSAAQSLGIGVVKTVLDSAANEGESETVLSGTIAPATKAAPAERRVYEPGDSVQNGEAVWKIGDFDGKADELRPEGGFGDIYEFKIGQEASKFPWALTNGGEAPKQVVVRFNSEAEGAARLLIGQLPFETDDPMPADVLVFLNDKHVGTIRGRHTPAEQLRLYEVGPFKLSAGDQKLALFWDEKGGGFAFDAMALVETDDAEVIPFDPAGLETRFDWEDGTTLPGGLSTGGLGYTPKIYMTVGLDPGRYALRLSGVEASLDSMVRLTGDFDRDYGLNHYVGTDPGALQFGPGFGMRGGQTRSQIDLPFTIGETGEHTLLLEDEWKSCLSWEQMEIVRLSDVVIGHRFVEPGGHVSILNETIRLPEFEETRTYRVLSDFPAVEIRIDRSLDSAAASKLLLGFRPAAVRLDGEAIRMGETELPAGDSASTYLVMTINEQMPKIGMRVTGCAEGTRLIWRPGEPVAIVSPTAERVQFKLQMGLIDTLYGADDLAQAMPEALDVHRVGELPATIENPLEVPVVKLVAIEDSTFGPYRVHEQGADGEHRWVFRGAQPALRAYPKDYLRLYLQPGGEARIAKAGWIDGLVKPAWGNQHTMAISDVEPTATGAQARVRVLDVSPFQFAPSVRFNGQITSAELDGEPWAYYEGDTLHLPIAQRDFEVSVDFAGEATPHLLRTRANVTRAVYEDGELVIEAEQPPWADPNAVIPRYAFALEGVTDRFSRAGYIEERALHSKSIIIAPTGTITLKHGR